MSVAEDDRDSDELRLATSIYAGDAAAFLALYRTHYEALCRFVYRYVDSRAAAEDIVAETFYRLWVTRGAWAVRNSLRGYLYTAARNQALDHLKRRRSEARSLDKVARDHEAAGGEAEPAEAEAHLAAQDVAASLQRAVDALTPRAREVLLLRWRAGLTNAQVAATLGVSVKTVEMHITRAYEELRRRLPPGLRLG